MGNVPNITQPRFPEQGRHAGQRCEVLFHYQGPALSGTVVRDDNEAPWVTIIKMDDGRHILSTECQYSPKV